MPRRRLFTAASAILLIACKDGGPPVETSDYSLSLSSTTLTISPGATGTTAVAITRINFTGAVTLSLANAPAGVTGSFDPAGPTGNSSTLTVSVAAAVTPGTYTVSVNGTGSPGAHSTSFTLTVNPTSDYSLSLSATSLTIAPGAAGTATVTITRTSFTGAVTLSLGNAPTGITGSFDPAGPTGTSSTVTVSVGATVAPGTYNLTVNGSPGAHSTPLTLIVSTAPDYSLSLSPTTIPIAPGAAGTTTVTITRSNFTGAVTLSLGNAPAGVTGSFNPAAPTGSSATLTLSVGTAVAPGTYNLTVNGAGSPGTHSTPLTLSVSTVPDYSLSLSPTTLTIDAGAMATTSVTITRSNFTGAVTLSLGSAPTGVTGSFNPAAPTGTSSTLTVSIGAAVAPGTYNLTVNGDGTPGTRSTPLTVTVGATRTASDRPDDVTGNQIRVIYAIPSDGIDAELDLNGQIANAVTRWQNWLGGQTNGRVFRLDTYQGKLDIGFVRFELTDAQMRNNDDLHLRDRIEQEMNRMGLIRPGKIYTVYYDGSNSLRCGGGAWPPTLIGQVAAMYLKGVQGTPCPRQELTAGPTDPPRYMDFAMIHELMHTLGIVDMDAPDHFASGHLNTCTEDPPQVCATDLMYAARAGDPGWNPTTLDIHRRDYYNPNGLPANIYNLATSPYLLP